MTDARKRAPDDLNNMPQRQHFHFSTFHHFHFQVELDYTLHIGVIEHNCNPLLYYRRKHSNTMMNRKQSIVSLTLSALAISGTDAFSSSPNTSHHRIATSLSAVNNENNNNNKLFQSLAATTAAMTILTSPLITSLPANADEYGRETEAPTLFTGETTMICKKRGPLGACLETTIRTAENDNDKASKYFRDPSEKVKARQAQALANQEEDNEGNALIQKLRKQSVDNKEKNDMIVRQKTLLNDQVRRFCCNVL